ncbi:MAG TPA: hypothetical protein VGG29_05705 [Caulobacteraceae bacterium]|jgi:hypothetical protein
MNALLGMALAAALITPNVRGYVSSWCLWTQIYDLHAVAVRCAGKLPPDVDARYRQLRRATEAAILRDASMRPGESDDTASAEMAQYAAKSRPINPARCADADLKRAVAIFGILTSPENVAKLRADLATRRDPYDGDCL